MNAAEKPLAATHLLERHHADSNEWDEAEGVCCFCLQQSLGTPADDAVSKKYFSDYDMMDADTGHVCAACAYCMNTRTLKQGHWIAHADGVEQPSTGDLLDTFRDLRAGAYDTPLAIHVTSSPIRSSHAYLWTPTNETATPLSIAFDRQTVRVDNWQEFAGLVAAIEDLRLCGFTFDEIRSGEPRVRNLREVGYDQYQECDTVIEPHRRTARLELALTLSRGRDDQPRSELTAEHDPLAHNDRDD